MDIYWGYNGMHSQQSDNIVLFDYIVYIYIHTHNILRSRPLLVDDSLWGCTSQYTLRIIRIRIYELGIPTNQPVVLLREQAAHRHVWKCGILLNSGKPPGFWDRQMSEQLEHLLRFFQRRPTSCDIFWLCIAWRPACSSSTAKTMKTGTFHWLVDE